jgi:toxin ParE1/3/4
MANYRFTHKALTDLEEIWEYSLEEWSENQAEKYYYILISACEKITGNPKLGKSYAMIQENLFGYTCEQHILFYQKTENEQIIIVRILHVRMDLKIKLT